MWLARTAFTFEGLHHNCLKFYHPVCVKFYSKRLNSFTLNTWRLTLGERRRERERERKRRKEYQSRSLKWKSWEKWETLYFKGKKGNHFVRRFPSFVRSTKYKSPCNWQSVSLPVLASSIPSPPSRGSWPHCSHTRLGASSVTIGGRVCLTAVLVYAKYTY